MNVSFSVLTWLFKGFLHRFSRLFAVVSPTELLYAKQLIEAAFVKEWDIYIFES